MKIKKMGWLFVLMSLSTVAFCQESVPDKSHSEAGEIMVRISEIEIDPDYLDEYIAILKEEAEASVRSEPEVICIFPMFQKEHPTEIRLLEIYANREAYESHLRTPHFKRYKETTLKMVKDLKLIDMEAISPETMPKIFRKLKQ